MTTTLDDVAALATAIDDADGLEDKNLRRVDRNVAIRDVDAPFPQIANAAGLSTAQVALILRTADAPYQALTNPTLRDMPPAKRRLLDTAERLFYARGICPIGVDQLIEEAETTKATFYKHFGSRDGIVEAYAPVTVCVDFTRTGEQKLPGFVMKASPEHVYVQLVHMGFGHKVWLPRDRVTRRVLRPRGRD